jgi:hypothetical protein
MGNISALTKPAVGVFDLASNVSEGDQDLVHIACFVHH